LAKLTGKKIKVLIADDHGLFREMLYHTISDEDDIDVVGQAVDGKEAVDMTYSLKPDILLLDINMPRMDGIEATKILAGKCPETKIVILTAIDDDDYVFRLVRAGATGYLMKDTSSEDVISAIRAAYSGESLIQPRVATKILKEFSKLLHQKDPEISTANLNDERKKSLEQLTERELEVLCLVGQGCNNKEIGAKLFIGEATVKTHVMNTMHKLNMRDRVELVLFAVHTGIVKTES
jgi:DNA-binding NarL/FixJ family response regulator